MKVLLQDCLLYQNYTKGILYSQDFQTPQDILISHLFRYENNATNTDVL